MTLRMKYKPRGVRKLANIVGAGLIAAIGISGLTSIANPEPAHAIFADPATSDGKYTQIIDWVQWGNQNNEIVIPAGGGSKTVTSTRQIGTHELSVTCTVDNLSHLQPQETGEAGQNTGQILTPPLVAYAPGSWAGDALDNLYNIGGPGYATHQNDPIFPVDFRNPNQMVIGLANPNPGIMNSAPITIGDEDTDGARMAFDFSCSAALNGSPVALDGLVFADAEASSSRNFATENNNNGPEWVQATPTDPNNVTWRLLEQARTCTEASAQASWPANNSLRLGVDGQECVYQGEGNAWPTPNPQGYGPIAVAFMDNNTPTSTMKARVELQGRGYSAVALGYVMSADFGDAPESYGEAGALFQPEWTGGVIQRDQNVNLSTHEQAQYSTRKANILGEKIDAEPHHQFSDDATADNLDGEDDEDGLNGSSLAADEYELPLSAFDGSASTYTVDDVTCYGSNHGTSQVYSWIDWNANGVFEESERSRAATCPSGGPQKISLTWDLPGDMNPDADHTFMRVRIAQTTATGGGSARVAQPTGLTLTGEVEDYRVRIPARLKVEKQWVVNGETYEHGEQPEGLDAVPTLSPDKDPAVTWAEWQHGYRPKETVTIGESLAAPIMEGCELTQSILTGDGISGSVDLDKGTKTAQVMLPKVHNEYTITNHVSCEQQLTLIKEIAYGEKSPSEWTLTATGPQDALEGPSGETGVNGKVTEDVAYKLSENGLDTYVPTADGWQCLDDRSMAEVDLSDDSVTLGLGQDVTCTITNTTAQLTLLKEVEGGSTPASAWKVSANPGDNDFGFQPHEAHGDTQQSSDNTWEVRPDQPFALEEALTDPDAPKAYFLDRVEKLEGDQWVEIEDVDAISVAAGTHDTYRFVNKAAPALEIPLTGGPSRDAYLLGGGIVLAFTAGLMLWNRRKKTH